MSQGLDLMPLSSNSSLRTNSEMTLGRDLEEQALEQAATVHLAEQVEVPIAPLYLMWYMGHLNRGLWAPENVSELILCIFVSYALH
jgi:hypothetical protein